MHTILYSTYIIGTRSLKVLFLVDGGSFMIGLDFAKDVALDGVVDDLSHG